jgi:hypothetical protein
MNTSVSKNRMMCLMNKKEVDASIIKAESYSVLYESNRISDTANDINIISLLLTGNCKEICFFGESSESIHDYADDIIIERDLQDIVTTWMKDQRISEISEYFIFVSGSKPNLLYAIFNNDSKLRSNIENELERCLLLE